MLDISVAWRQSGAAVFGDCLKGRFTCHANDEEETNYPEHLERNEGGTGFSETSRAELQRPSPGAGDLLEEAEGGLKVVRLERGELSLLIGLLTTEIGKGENPDYCQRIIAIRDKLPTIFAESETPPGDGDLPDFRDYMLEKYPEMEEDLITMIEDLIKRQRQKVTGRR
jgi:hypothetical protein